MAGRLCRAGSDQRKFIRQILVSMDITAPLYWWKEFDTYKVGTVANSTSTMHKIHAKPFELADFSTDHMTAATLAQFRTWVDYLEQVRLRYMENKDKADWSTLPAAATSWTSGTPSAASSPPCPTPRRSFWPADRKKSESHRDRGPPVGHR